ncbi:hypothetical protein G6F32_014538 [Rhizopus arrhizus]|nr:hypothetical protein G6F32_014538 [Rhizopus arrhizus]
MRPGREVPMDEASIARVLATLRERFDVDTRRSALYQDLKSGLAPAGVEYYLPLFFEETATLFDYLTAGTVTVTPLRLPEKRRRTPGAAAVRAVPGQRNALHPPEGVPPPVADRRRAASRLPCGTRRERGAPFRRSDRQAARAGANTPDPRAAVCGLRRPARDPGADVERVRRHA